MIGQPELSIRLTGDLIFDEPEPDHYFDSVRDLLAEADIVVGHLEVPFTSRPIAAYPGREISRLRVLRNAGFDVATLAANHLLDAGQEGVRDTLAGLRELGIASAGAGLNLEEARRPAIVERRGLRVGFLSYNCVGPRESWASATKPGCAYVEVLTHYELDYAAPGGPPRVFTFAVPDSLEAMQADIERVRREVDILLVALHKGLIHTPVTLAMYERPVAHAAIDAGADAVVSHHAHIVHGVEVFRGRPIFHGLGNFVTVTRALNLTDNPDPAMLAWARKRRELFGFEPDPQYPTYPFHPEAKNAMIAECTVDSAGDLRGGFIPCFIKPSGHPEPLAKGPRGEAVAAYVARVSEGAGLRTCFDWQDGRVIVSADR
ncbi:MAG: CapA family protein [Candidatus Dormibacteraeota bacterium]|nr:CapA family protein [Candidatus Dormibacteraeota bacterium]